MSTPHPKPVATSSGFTMYHENHKIYFVDERSNWGYTLMFVVGLVTFLMFVGGIIFMSIGEGTMFWVGTVLLIFGLSGGVLNQVSNRQSKKNMEGPLDEKKHICIIDLTKQSLYGPDHNMLSPMLQVTIEKKMQLTSSSKALVINYPGGSIEICKGNPFGGGTVLMEQALKDRALM